MSEQTYHESASLDFAHEAEMQVRGVIRDLNKAAVASDYNDDPRVYGDEYRALADTLERLAGEVRTIPGHQHQWNGEDYCNICGQDGRA